MPTDEIASASTMGGDAANVIATGQAALGIELGSTRIKACLVGPSFVPLATGSHEWENQLVDGRWTYSLDAVHAGLRACYVDLVADIEARYGVRPARFRAIGISAMMHGYLAFDDTGTLLTPFRTWRNTSTGEAAAELTAALGFNVPLRWSIAHLYQAVLDREPHVAEVARLTTLAGYVHGQLTGQFVLGVGDASGMFPIDPATGGFDRRMLATVDAMVADRVPNLSASRLLPTVMGAGRTAGTLTVDGALLLDPTGHLQPGIPLCAPEGDAGTGMVATNSVTPRTGNVSVGTSIFAMIVLEGPLASVHPEIDIVTTPDGVPVAMVHCNNGASELAAWAGVFTQFAAAIGHSADMDATFAALLHAAVAGGPDAGRLLAYNYLSGEPIAGVDDGRPLFLRPPGSDFRLENFARAQVYSVFATLSLGMAVLADEGVQVDMLLAHGGLFRTPEAPQRLMAAATGVPIAVQRDAGEGGSWGIALLAAYLDAAPGLGLGNFLSTAVFSGESRTVVEPDPADVAGFAAFLRRYRAGLELERRAAAAAPESPA